MNYEKMWKTLKAEALRDCSEWLYSEMDRLEANSENNMKVTPEELHIWYLEATEQLKGKEMHFNPNAQKPYLELTDEQKFIDEYIAKKINDKLLTNYSEEK